MTHVSAQCVQKTLETPESVNGQENTNSLTHNECIMAVVVSSAVLMLETMGLFRAVHSDWLTNKWRGVL